MPTMEERNYTGEHLVSEANGTRSRETETVAAEQVLEPGTVVAKVTATGQIVQIDHTGDDGSEDAYGISYGRYETGEGETRPGVFHVRDCEVRASGLVWPEDITSGAKDAAIAALADEGVILR